MSRKILIVFVVALAWARISAATPANSVVKWVETEEWTQAWFPEGENLYLSTFGRVHTTVTRARVLGQEIPVSTTVVAEWCEWNFTCTNEDGCASNNGGCISMNPGAFNATRYEFFVNLGHRQYTFQAYRDLRFGKSSSSGSSRSPFGDTYRWINAGTYRYGQATLDAAVGDATSGKFEQTTNAVDK